MIPSILAWQLQNGMGDFVDTSFPMANEPFKGSLRKMADTKGALFHDPYVSVRLPFRKAEGASFSFEGFQMDKTPYVHQQKAFERLTGDDGRSTVIATGTGSGKTECFLYPILDYCYRHRADPARGIKAIIVYPMNALASDQARRIAGIIHKNPKLNGAVSCGMYVGGKNIGGAVRMTETEVISDHETLLKYPPDILLTNYKMLDYLLVRPKDSALWRNNDPYTLKYIAVDELHTFDGAQGTDLACLIRRLKKRLDIGKGYLCCVGTSATMGSGDDAGNIRNYAEEIFGERFEEGAVITEDRLSSDDFFVGGKALYGDIPSDETVSSLDALVEENDVEGYLELAARSWFPGPEYGDIGSDEARIDLGLKLMRHETFRKLMFFAEGKYVQSRAVAKELPELGEGRTADSRICSLYALISHARAGTPGSTMPFLNVQVQFWMKELRRLVGKVDAARVTYALSPDLTTEQRKRFLPVVNCRECGMTGWATLRDLHETSLELPSVEEFYNKYFDPSSSSQILMAFPSGQGEEGVDTKKYELCPNCLHFSFKKGNAAGKCSVCGAETMTVDIPELQKTSANARGQFVCPYCGSRRGLTILGLRSTREISAALSQIFASRYNDDKKVLAFSDSVQDAAHKAGFFNSRTWKYSLHSSLQHYCDAGGGDGKSLDDFQDGYIKYLHREYSDADIVGYFTAPNMTWRYSYEDTVKSGRWEGRAQDKKFMEDLESRLKYEILLEYGLSGNFGKTLEKTGCSVLSFRREDVAHLAQMTREVAVNEYGLTEEPIETFYNICIGVLTQLKSSGAFADDVFDKFLARNCETFMLDEHINRWLPRRQTGRNTPRFYAKHLSYDRKMTDQLDSKDSSRYRNWIRDCVRNSPMKLDPESCGEICDFVIGSASDAGILQSVSVGETREVFGINKQSVFVTGKVRQMRCDKCGISFAVSESDVEFWKGAPCRRRVCRGTLHADEDTGADYFGRLYKDGDFYKINAKEHTGLLEKDVREKTETDFKRHTGRSAWDPNVLSCTPTLEMGIDVGDLSTVVLCSVPPVQSQFTQRSGRAGRTDGNALTIAVANAVSHDLYFYEDPLDMIEGRVEPPRIFLEASAVLERQLTAFCMDTWVKRYGGADLIPASVGQILGAMESGDEKLFPYNFIKYVQGNKHTLFIQFADILGIESDHTCFDELRAFIGETRSERLSIDLKIVDAFQVLRKQVESLQSDIGELKNRVSELKRGVQDSSIDSDIKRAENEVKALAAVIGQIKKKNVFNFLSDEGILPNYAFPEAGVILRAVLFRKNSDDDDDATGYRTVPYEYSRSAASAISEFAPGNTFYVDGKKLVVDQIDLKTSSLEKWRLCPNCSYAELETSVNTKVCCPRCGSPGWRDIGQVKYMIKAQTVYSNMSYRETLIDDSSDNRISSFYNEQLLVDVDTENDIEKAYRIKSDEYDFGYEFDKKATIRDINFGSKDSVGEKTTVAGNSSVRKGFTICGECGKGQTRGSAPSPSFKSSHYHKET
ncbi:MAG: DEAD/DEAH box helicase, partial [Bacteroidales bacterium]|nr:DEAD/DEAH box helicase [Bacteroidales bacterium]